MADFELIDTKRFLKDSQSPSETSKTSRGVRDDETYAFRGAYTSQRNPDETSKNSLGGVLLGDITESQDESIIVRHTQEGLAGFAAPTGVSENKRGIKIMGRGDSLPRLPFALERLVSAASSNLLTGFTFDGVPDINRYVMAWACCYLVGDRDEALNRLRQVQIAREASV